MSCSADEQPRENKKDSAVIGPTRQRFSRGLSIKLAWDNILQLQTHAANIITILIVLNCDTNDVAVLDGAS